MHVTRIDVAPVYEAPRHFDMVCRYLQGRDAGPAEQLWLGLSEIAPGGHTGLDPSAMEKHYVVLEGQLTLIGEHGAQRDEAVLGPLDSARFAPGEARQLVNRSNRVAKVLLAMPLHPPA